MKKKDCDFESCSNLGQGFDQLFQTCELKEKCVVEVKLQSLRKHQNPAKLPSCKFQTQILEK